MGFIISSKLEKMKAAFRGGNYEKALLYAEKIKLDDVRTAYDLSMMAEVFLANDRPKDAKDIYVEMYRRNKSVSTCKEVIKISIKTKSVKQAVNYIKELASLDSDDYERYIYQYQVGRILKQPDDYLIACLKKVREADYIDIWALELAKLYFKNGMRNECVAECHNIKLWFPGSSYEEKANILIKACKEGLSMAAVAKLFKQVNDVEPSYEEDRPAPKAKEDDYSEDSNYAEEADYEETSEEDYTEASYDDQEEYEDEAEEYPEEAEYEDEAEEYPEEAEYEDEAEEYPEEAEYEDEAEEYPEEAEYEDEAEEYPEEAEYEDEAEEYFDEEESYEEQDEPVDEEVAYDEEEYYDDEEEDFSDYEDDEDELRLREEYYRKLAEKKAAAEHKYTERFDEDLEEIKAPAMEEISADFTEDNVFFDISDSVQNIMEEETIVLPEDDREDIAVTLVNDSLTADVLKALLDQEESGMGKLDEMDEVDESILRMISEDER